MNSCEPARPPAASQLAMLKLIDAAGGKLYPALYKSLYTGWRHGEKLQSLIALITRRDTFINRHGKTYVSLSIRQIRDSHGKGGLDTWQKYLKAFASWGLLEQYKPREGIGSVQAERNAIAYAKEQAKVFGLSGDYVNPTTWYYLPEYTPSLLLEADRKASEYKTSLTKADWIANAGKKEADRIYNDHRGISRKRQRVQEVIETTLTASIHDSGYATDNAILTATETATGISRRYIASTLRGIRQDLIDRYNLQWGRPSKQQVEEHGLKGYGYIYLQDRE